MQALAATYEIKICARELALSCQQAENLVVGAPCGVMDQMTASCGEANHLLELLCQPADLKGTVAFPEEWSMGSIQGFATRFPDQTIEPCAPPRLWDIESSPIAQG
jgi:L-arabinokinase